jgi:hypothetical protein
MKPSVKACPHFENRKLCKVVARQAFRIARTAAAGP